MTPRHRRHRQNSHKIRNHPVIRHHPSQPRSQRNHHRNGDQRKGHAELEPFQDQGHFLEEGGGGDLLGGGAPGHVVAEHVGDQGGGDVEGEAAEEDGEHEGPFKVFGDWRG